MAAVEAGLGDQQGTKATTMLDTQADPATQAEVCDLVNPLGPSPLQPSRVA